MVPLIGPHLIGPNSSASNGACLICMANARKIVRIIQACELSKPILHYILFNDRQFCPGQPCELSGRCELARVKLSGIHWSPLYYLQNVCTSPISMSISQYLCMFPSSRCIWEILWSSSIPCRVNPPL